MTQLDLIADCIVPPKDSQCYKLLLAYQRGERLTVGSALSKYGVYALSQRNGDLRRRYGWPIQSRTVRTAGGADISEYWIDA